jgi:hypothetical protein
LSEVSWDLKQLAGRVGELRCKNIQNFTYPVQNIMHRQGVDLLERVGKTVGEGFHKSREDLRVVLDGSNNLGIGNGDDLALFQCHSPIRAGTSADTELSSDLTFLANAINDLTAVPGDRADFHKAAPDKEKGLLLVSDFVNDRAFFIEDWSAPTQKNIVKLALEK